MIHIDLFSGIGGFAYAARQVWPDYRNLFFCEINPFCKAVLKKNFGNDILIFDDIKTITVEEVWKRYAQDVKPENLLEKTGGVENVNPNTELNITTTTERHGSNIQTKEDGSKECRLSKPMVESASVVEKRSQNFSPLITNMVEETKSDRRLDVDTPFTLKSLGVDSQKDSNYFATTAITQKDSMGNAPTKNRDVTLERVIADRLTKRQSNAIMDTWQNKASDTMEPRPFTEADCQSKTLRPTMEFPDRQSGKSCNAADASCGPTSDMENQITSTGEPPQVTGHKTFLNRQSKKESLSSLKNVSNVGQPELSKTEDRVSRRIIQITQNHLRSNGSAKSAIMSGISTTGREGALDESPAGRVDLLTGGFP